MSLNKDYRAIVEEDRKKLSNYHAHPDSIDNELERLKKETSQNSINNNSNFANNINNNQDKNNNYIETILEDLNQLISGYCCRIWGRNEPLY